MATTTDQQAAQHKQRERAKRLVASLLERTTEAGFTEAEAMESAAKVGALLAQNDLELTDCIVRDVSDMVRTKVFAADDAASSIIMGIGRLCSLVVYHDSGAKGTQYSLFGHAPDVELATYLWEVCAEAAETGWAAYIKATGVHTGKARSSFRIGYGGRVYRRLVQLREEREAAARARAVVSNCTSLVVLKDQIVEAEFAKTGVKLRSRRGPAVHDRGAYNKGREHGNSVNLSNPLNGPDQHGALR